MSQLLFPSKEVYSSNPSLTDQMISLTSLMKSTATTNIPSKRFIIKHQIGKMNSSLLRGLPIRHTRLAAQEGSLNTLSVSPTKILNPLQPVDV